MRKPFYYQLNYYRKNQRNPQVVIFCRYFDNQRQARRWAQDMSKKAIANQNEAFPGLKKRPRVTLKDTRWNRPRSLSIKSVRPNVTIDEILRLPSFSKAAGVV